MFYHLFAYMIKKLKCFYFSFSVLEAIMNILTKFVFIPMIWARGGGGGAHSAHSTHPAHSMHSTHFTRRYMGTSIITTYLIFHHFDYAVEEKFYKDKKYLIYNITDYINTNGSKECFGYFVISNHNNETLIDVNQIKISHRIDADMIHINKDNMFYYCKNINTLDLYDNIYNFIYGILICMVICCCCCCCYESMGTGSHRGNMY